MSTINKKDIVRIIRKSTYYSSSAVENIVDRVFVVIADAMAEGRNVSIKDFGTFKPTLRKPRTGRNPCAKENVFIPARFRPIFKASPYLNKMVEISLNDKVPENPSKKGVSE